MAKKKNSRPEMSWIEKRQKWRKRVIIGEISHDVYGDTKEEVREKIRDMQKQVEQGITLGNAKTLVQFALEWYPIKTANLRSNSASVYKNVINNHIAPYFENKRLSDIKPINVEKFMTSKANLSYSSQAKILYTLSQMMESAMKNGLISKNPCNGIKAGGEHSKIKKPLSEDEQRVLIESVKGRRPELFVLLCLRAGLRREEALGLLWEDVHLERVPYIDVRHTVSFPDSGAAEFTDKLKSKAAYRSIPIPPVLANALRCTQESVNSIFVVPSVTTGERMTLSAFRRMWEIARKSVPFHIEPHILRHTYLTELCASGMDIKKIQYLAGHEDVTMTLRIYTHVKNHSPELMSEDIIKTFSGSNTGSKE